MDKRKLVTEKRNYAVVIGKQAKEIAALYLKKFDINFEFGLAEPNDRYHEWKIPILFNETWIGEVYVDAFSGQVNQAKTTDHTLLKGRAAQSCPIVKDQPTTSHYQISPLANTAICGDSIEEIDKMPPDSVDLIFTSPPYYNARPQYEEYENYETYLSFIQSIVQKCNRVLVEGRFFVVNISHVLVPRTNRNKASTRLAVPFDFHRIFTQENYEFIDDIIWVKPEGAGWASGRGRRFAADRNPLQYKAVPVSEYVLVYRKKSSRLIDWFIKNHPDQNLVKDSKIGEGYEKTNIWQISPSRSKIHPAVFPQELAEKVIKYYSFKNDVVMDPFAGIGTVGKAAAQLGRRYYLIEKEEKYISHFQVLVQ